MFYSIIALSLASASLAFDPTVNIYGWSAGDCKGVNTVSYQLTKPQDCVTFDKTFTSANITTTSTDTKGCEYSFFEKADCFRTSLIAAYDYGNKGVDQCDDFNSKEVKSAVLNCPF